MISKNNRTLQITVSKEMLEQLDTLIDAFKKEGIIVSRSIIMVNAFDLYIKMLVMNSKVNELSTEEEEPQKENNNA